MALRVLVTRPEPGAAATAARLAALGFEPLILPLTETRPLEIEEMPGPASFEAVAATSASALRHAPADLLAAISGLRLFVVGERTAEIARTAGFGSVEGGGGDVDALARHIGEILPRGARILYLCGRVRTGALAERLTEAGFSVTVIETYDTVPVEHARRTIRETLGTRPVAAAFVYSANGATMLSRLALDADLAGSFSSARFLCISERVAEALAPELRARADIAPTPDEAALLKLLGQAG